MKDLFILQGKKFVDKRGWLKETFKESYFNKKMVFSITSKSKKNVLRGLHLQTKKTQDKLITCMKGKILDVAVDLRKNSKTFGKHHKIVISEKNAKSFFFTINSNNASNNCSNNCFLFEQCAREGGCQGASGHPDR